MWIWAGANIAPVNWALGRARYRPQARPVGDHRGDRRGQPARLRHLRRLHGDGPQDGVNQMVLSRSAFGRRGAYLPSALMFLMTLGWIGVNTYFPVKIAMAILGQFGIPDTLVATLIVITVVMVVQVLIGIYGFYAIRTFEKYTVPVTVAIMVLMSVSRLESAGCRQLEADQHASPGAHLAMLTLLMSAIGSAGEFPGSRGPRLFALRAPQRLLDVGLLV